MTSSPEAFFCESSVASPVEPFSASSRASLLDFAHSDPALPQRAQLTATPAQHRGCRSRSARCGGPGQELVSSLPFRMTVAELPGQREVSRSRESRC